jgi:hypothetical protein
MNENIKVYLLGGDRGGWALDTEMRLARQALARLPGVELVDDPGAAQVLHTVWPEQLLEKRELRGIWAGKTVVASFSNDPRALFERVPGLFDAAREWVCVGQSALAAQELRELGIPRVGRVAYRADEGAFRPVPTGEVSARRALLGIAEDAYVVGFFQRDSEGRDVLLPKVQKAPDFFAAIMHEVSARHPRLHVLLAGPRRHWVRRELHRLGVRFSFYGKITEGDDYAGGVISRDEMNLLVNCCELNVVTSRWEGAPRALMESVAVGKKTISTPVGIAADLLEPVCLFSNLAEATALIARDLRENHLAATIAPQQRRLEARHGLAAVTEDWRAVYEALEVRDGGAVRAPSGWLAKASATLHRVRRKLVPSPSRKVFWVREARGTLGAALEGELLRLGCLAAAVEEADVLLVDGVPPSAQGLEGFRGSLVLHRWVPGAPVDEFYAWNRRHAGRTLFSTSRDWIDAVKAGHDAARPRVVRDSLFMVQSREPERGPRVGVVGGAYEQLVPLGEAPVADVQALLLLDDSPASRLHALHAAYRRRPVIYPAESGAGEFVGYAGLSYRKSEEIAGCLETLAAYPAGWGRAAVVPEAHETLLRYVNGDGDF